MEKVIDEITYSYLVIITICVLMFATVKVLVTTGERRSFLKTMISFFVAVPVGLTAGFVAITAGLTIGVTLIITVLSTLLGEQIVLAIVSNRLNVSDLVDRALKNLIDRYTK